jgi:subtilisin family serine protease
MSHRAGSCALWLVSCAAALGCSQSGERALGTERQFSTNGDACGVLNVADTATVGEPFRANVEGAPGGASYDWDGTGLSIEAHGSAAILRCKWVGRHTLTLDTNIPGCETRTAVIACKPSACQGPSGSSCSGIRVSKQTPLLCPHSNVLLEAPSKDSCPEEIRGQGGKWVGGALLRAPYAASDPRPYLCSYFWDAPPDNGPDTGVLPADRETWDWDCARVAAHGQYTAMNAALAEFGRTQLGSIEWSSNLLPAPVRIAVVDTAANRWNDPDNNPHGKAVGALALDTACPDPADCNVSVENYLGLPLYRDHTPNGDPVIRRDVLHGGAFGAPGDVARAIVAAIDASPATHTVLNLSLAYESPELPPSLLPLRRDYGNRIMLAALRYARCRGALILAAAGNGPVPAEAGQLPGLPARWAGLPALSAQECHDRFDIVPNAVDDGPLLYPVSGLDFAAQPLLTTRGGGQAVLAALGFAAVREEPDGGFTRRLTGTSVATAAVSGIAALLWSHAGQLSPDGVMQELYAGSPDTNIEPDFLPFQPAASPLSFRTVRHITRCSIAAPERATCTSLGTPVSALPAGTLPPLSNDTAPEEAGPSAPLQGGISPWTFPHVLPQPPEDPGCGTCTWKLLPRRLDLGLRSSFPTSSIPTMQLVAKTKSVLAARAMALMAETDEVTSVATVPTPAFSVSLSEDLSPSSAELTYQKQVDSVTVNLAESVVITEDDAP